MDVGIDHVGINFTTFLVGLYSEGLYSERAYIRRGLIFGEGLFSGGGGIIGGNFAFQNGHIMSTEPKVSNFESVDILWYSEPIS